MVLVIATLKAQILKLSNMYFFKKYNNASKQIKKVNFELEILFLGET